MTEEAKKSRAPRAPKTIKGENTPNTRGAAEEAQGPATEPAEQPAEAVKTANSSIAYVIDQSGNVARSYTHAEHGPKFRDLAAQYAKKIGGRVR